MNRSTLRALLLSGAALGAFGLASPASANIANVPPTPTTGDFQIIEQCIVTTGCNGTFTVVNNSGEDDAAWYIYSFEVGNPNATADGTTQTSWNASLVPCVGSCSGNIGFLYANSAGASDLQADLANDVGPGTSSNLFTFSASTTDSPITLDLVDSSGDTAIVTSDSDLPEPASLAVLGSGLLGLFGVTRRNRKRTKV